MPRDANILASLGLAELVEDENFGRDADGVLSDRNGGRIVFGSAEAMLSLREVLEAEHAGAWSIAMKASGQACGRGLTAHLESRLAALGKPALAALPLEAGLAFIERFFSTRGLGRLIVDLSFAAEHGLVVARLEHSYFVEVFATTEGFVDAMPAGLLQSFFEHISGQTLDCEEISCARNRSETGSAPSHCTFVITDPERLAAIRARLRHDSVDVLFAKLKS